MTRLDFQLDRPLFVKHPSGIRAGGQHWPKNKHFPWKEMHMPMENVRRMYIQGMLIHDELKEEASKVGDGLEVMSLTALHVIVDGYNERLQKVVTTKTQFEQKKAKKSTIADKQRGLIRSWRRNFEDWLLKAEANK